VNRRVDRLLEAAFEEYGARLYRFACLLLGNAHEAEDLCQNAFCELAKSIHRFEGRSSLYTWLHRIMLHLFYKELGDRKKRTALREEVAREERRGSSRDSAVTPNCDGRDRTIILRTKIGELTRIHQSVLILKYFQGLSYAHMAEVLECPVGTVRSRLHAAKRELKEFMEEVVPDEM